MAEIVKAVPVAKADGKPVRTPGQRHSKLLAAAELVCYRATEYEKRQNSSMAPSQAREIARSLLLEAAVEYGRLVAAHFRNR